MYDTVQEERLLVRCRTGSRSIEYTLEASPLSDRGQVVIDAALDEQTLDLDGHHDQDGVDVSVDEAS